MDIPQEAPEPSDSESDDSTISFHEVNQPMQGKNEALAFVQSVKVAFGAHLEKYDEFVQLMRDFKNNRITIEVYQLRFSELFKEHSELVAGFNPFLPVGHGTSLLDGIEDGLRFVNKVEEAYRHDKIRYKSFLHLLNRSDKELSIVEVYDGVRMLFHDRPDLIYEFTKFLPDRSDPVTTGPVDHQRKLNKRHRKWRKGRVLFFLIAFFLLLSLAVAFGMGIRLGSYQS